MKDRDLRWKGKKWSSPEYNNLVMYFSQIQYLKSNQIKGPIILEILVQFWLTWVNQKRTRCGNICFILWRKNVPGP